MYEEEVAEEPRYARFLSGHKVMSAPKKRLCNDKDKSGCAREWRNGASKIIIEIISLACATLLV